MTPEAQARKKAQTELFEEQALAVRAARLALTNALEHPDITPEQALEAARLLAVLGGYSLPMGEARAAQR